MPTDQEKLNFSFNVESLAKDKDISLLDALLLYCDNNDIEYALAANLLTIGFQRKLTEEAQELNLLKNKTKNTKLPI